MRILVLGNMANDGYYVAKALRSAGIDAHLGILYPDFGMAFPEWEEVTYDGKVDPYSFTLEKKKSEEWKRPEWIKYIDTTYTKYFGLDRASRILKKMRTAIDIYRLVEEYDVIEAHIPFPMYCHFTRRPYMVYDAGWIRYFPYQHDIRSKLVKRGYRLAKQILVTNPDTLKIFDSLDYIKKDRVSFMPFAIDSAKYRPLDLPEFRTRFVTEGELLLVSPSRQIWHEKGNDKMFAAFAQVLKKNGKVKLLVAEWGPDVARSKDLVEQLGIQKNIIWFKPVSKPVLIAMYSAADMVLDQFVLGSWGTATPEAMACGKPVLMYFDPVYIDRCFGEMPPIPNSRTEQEIAKNISMLIENSSLREEIGRKSREWIMKTHSFDKVARLHMDIIKQII